MTVSFDGSDNKSGFESLDNFLIEDETAFKMSKYFSNMDKVSVLQAYGVLSYPNIPIELLDAFFNKWPEEKIFMLTAIVDNREYYSDELLRYITSFDYHNIWTTLFSHVEKGKITYDQVNILWEREELYYKHRFIMNIIYVNTETVIPEYMWVEYYVYISDEKYVDKYFSHSKSIVDHLGGADKLRSAFINYIKSYDDNASSLESLPFSWLMELAKTNITITGK